jgi:hypothetical protein
MILNVELGVWKNIPEDLHIQENWNENLRPNLLFFFFQEGKVAEVYVSYVADDGDVFLQFESYSYVHSLVSSVIETCLKEASVVKGSKSSYYDPSRLYLARYHLDGNWYRAAITKKLDGQKEVCHGIAAILSHLTNICFRTAFAWSSQPIYCSLYYSKILLRYSYYVININTFNLYHLTGMALPITHGSSQMKAKTLSYTDTGKGI